MGRNYDESKEQTFWSKRGGDEEEHETLEIDIKSYNNGPFKVSVGRKVANNHGDRRYSLGWMTSGSARELAFLLNEAADARDELQEAEKIGRAQPPGVGTTVRGKKHKKEDRQRKGVLANVGTK